jgi:uncharacterized coiled-coil protein SlyX
MTEQETVERFVPSLIQPLHDVGALLAQAIDDTNRRVDNVVERLEAMEANAIARAEGRTP